MLKPGLIITLLLIQNIAAQAAWTAPHTESVPNLPVMNGFKHRMCQIPAISSECWEENQPRYLYVTRGGLRIDSNCLVKDSADELWKYFPIYPSTYLRAAEDVARKIKGKYSQLNPTNAEILLDFIQFNQPIITCMPQGEFRDRDRACAYAVRGLPEIVLTRPVRCGGLSKVLFHELLHAADVGDNFSENSHNSVSCRSHDAIYGCLEILYPSAVTPKWLHQSGCLACVAEGQEAVCSKLPNEWTEQVSESQIRCR